MEDAPKPRSKGNSKWKRPPTKVYGYNYDVGEHYYKPMTRYLESKDAGSSTAEPPKAMTFAERLAADPLYGKYKPLDKVSSEIPTRSPAPAYVDDYVPPKRSVDAGLGDDGLKSRPLVPSVSDQIMESAGIDPDVSLDDFLAKLRKRREHQKAETDRLLSELDKDGDDEAPIRPRRNILDDLNSVAKMEDASLGNYSTANLRREALAAESLVASSSVQTSSKINIRKRNVKTTITTETVRH